MTVYVELSGGLGNQLFQLSFSKYLEEEFGVKTLIETDRITGAEMQIIRPFIEFLEIKESRVSRSCHKFPGWLKFHNVRSTILGEKVLNRLLDGSETDLGIFSNDCDWIYQDYAQKEIYARRIKSPLISYLGSNPNSIHTKILVHVRRGDMENNPNTKAFHGLVSIEKLLSNVQVVREKIGIDAEALVVSDSFEAGKNLSSKMENSRYVDSESYVGFDLLRNMTGAKGYVLSNSTLGWWAAFISNPREVVAPRQWFRNSEHHQIMVKDWIWN